MANTKSVMGLFWDERYKSILEPPLNLVLSILLAQRFGIFGILAGTLISTMALPFWVEPLGLYRHGLKQPVGGYFLCCLKYLLITAAAAGLTGGACLAAGSGIFGLVQKCMDHLGAGFLNLPHHYGTHGGQHRNSGRLHRGGKH